MELDFRSGSVLVKLVVVCAILLCTGTFMQYSQISSSSFPVICSPDKSLELQNASRESPSVSQIPKELSMKTNVQNENKLPKSILVVASYRGGSTLAGEFFNRHDNVLYYFGMYAE